MIEIFRNGSFPINISLPTQEIKIPTFIIFLLGIKAMYAAGQLYKDPSFHPISTFHLEKEKKETQQKLEKLRTSTRKQWQESYSWVILEVPRSSAKLLSENIYD